MIRDARGLACALPGRSERDVAKSLLVALGSRTWTRNEFSPCRIQAKHLHGRPQQTNRRMTHSLSTSIFHRGFSGESRRNGDRCGEGRLHTIRETKSSSLGAGTPPSGACKGQSAWRVVSGGLRFASTMSEANFHDIADEELEGIHDNVEGALEDGFDGEFDCNMSVSLSFHWPSADAFNLPS